MSLCCPCHYDPIPSDRPLRLRPPPTLHLVYQAKTHPPAFKPNTPCCLTLLLEHAGPGPRLTEVGACELGKDAEGAGLGGASAGLPVLSVLDQPLLAAVVGNKTGQVLHPEAVPAHTHTTHTQQQRTATTG